MFVLLLLSRYVEGVILMIRIFRFLEDGAWHDLKEIAWKMRIPVEDLSDYCEMLFKREIVEYDSASCRVRIGSEFLNMITVLNAWDRSGKKWRRRGAGTVIVPPQKHCQIQGISVQNMTEQDLRVDFTFKMKPIEIVISRA